MFGMVLIYLLTGFLWREVRTSNSRLRRGPPPYTPSSISLRRLSLLTNKAIPSAVQGYLLDNATLPPQLGPFPTTGPPATGYGSGTFDCSGVLSKSTTRSELI